jgi:hypothetical protein
VPTTGKLECRWQIEPVAETPAEVPDQGEEKATRVACWASACAASGPARSAPHNAEGGNERRT